MRHTLPFLILWLCISCSATRTQHTQRLETCADSTHSATATTAMQHDSTRQGHTLQREAFAEQRLLSITEAIAESRTSLTLPLVAVERLPDGAAYTTHEGRTAVQITRRGDSIHITGRSEAIPRERISMQTLHTQTDRQAHAFDTTTTLRTDSAASTAASASDHSTSLTQERRKTPSAWLKITTWLLPALIAALLLGWRYLSRR